MRDWDLRNELFTAIFVSRNFPESFAHLVASIEFLKGAGILEEEKSDELQDLRQYRNDIVHGQADPATVITIEMLERL